MSELPVHFLTIVQNGLPYIQYHLSVFNKLPFKWYWHIVEGISQHHHDTRWGRLNGGGIYADMHKNGLSNDGTTEYLDLIARDCPDKVTVYRKPFQKLWDGKLEMANAPLGSIKEECLLWQVDADELWTVDQIKGVHALFMAHPSKTAAYFRCQYFVGPDLWIENVECYGNHSAYEWLRVWRFKPGDRWLTHEPPQLVRFGMDIGKIYPFTHLETAAVGRFQHFAYATERQLKFKQDFYGYKDAVTGWHRLQNHERFPCSLGDFFPWAGDGALVNRASKAGIKPLIQL